MLLKNRCFSYHCFHHFYIFVQTFLTIFCQFSFYAVVQHLKLFRNDPSLIHPLANLENSVLSKSTTLRKKLVSPSTFIVILYRRLANLLSFIASCSPCSNPLHNIKRFRRSSSHCTKRKRRMQSWFFTATASGNSIDSRTVENVVEIVTVGVIYGCTVTRPAPQLSPGIEMSSTAFQLHLSFLLERKSSLYTSYTRDSLHHSIRPSDCQSNHAVEIPKYLTCSATPE